MTRKTTFLTVILIAIFASSSFAIQTPPSKGQWAYPLESTLRLYDRPDSSSRSREIDMPQKWISVPSAVRDDNNYLWYKVKINGREGWLAQDGIRLKMGGKSKLATNLAKNYAKARRKVMNNPGKWTHYTDNDDGTIIYEISGKTGHTLFCIAEGKSEVEDIFFGTNDHSICRDFLGVDLIGLSQPEVRSKLGTPTMRHTPYESPEISVLFLSLLTVI